MSRKLEKDKNLKNDKGLKKEEKCLITDLMNEIDLEAIQDIEIEDIDTRDNKIEDNKIEDAALQNTDKDAETLKSLKRIKQKALVHAQASMQDISYETQAQVNSECSQKQVVNETEKLEPLQKAKIVEIEKLKQQKSRKYKGFRRSILIPLVAIISLIGATLAAIQTNSTLNNFFGDLFPYADQVQVVGTKQIKSGIIYTVEGAFIDNNSGLFIVSMMKEDGSSFEEGTVVKNMRLEMDRPNGMGWYAQSYLEDQNKKLVTVMNLSCNKPLYKNELTLVAEDLIQRESHKQVAMDLNKLYEAGKFITLKGNEENWYDYNREDGLNLHLVKDFTEFSIDDVRLSDVGLSLLTSYPDVMGIQDRTVNLSMIDTRTEKEYDFEKYSHWEDVTGLNKNSFVVKGVKAEDLPYLKVQFMEDYDKELMAETWEVKFKLSKNSQVISKMILQRIKVMEDTLLLTHIDVSALGITLKGYGESGNLVHLDVNVVMKDGEEKRVTYSGSSNGMGGMTCYYDLGTNSESYIPDLINLEDVLGIKIGDKIIKLSNKK